MQRKVEFSDLDGKGKERQKKSWMAAG